MNFSEKKQSGLTFITMMIILGLIAFFVLLAFKIGPIYINHSKVVNALAAIEKMEDIESMRKSEVRISLAKRLNMNYVDKVIIDDFDIIKRPNFLSVTLEYERVETILGNLSVLVEFNESFEVGEGT
ncbi:MAG: DUF4845 domain-containing protein [Methylococcales bacterium]|nr:DUF4845 domain-containing protein [Methylococcales bacterium]